MGTTSSALGRPAGRVGSKILEIYFYLLENLSAYSELYFSRMLCLQDFAFKK